MTGRDELIERAELWVSHDVDCALCKNVHRRCDCPSVKLVTELVAAGWRPPVREDVIERAAEVLFEWNTPGDPYFVIRGRAGESSESSDPYEPIARALADAGLLADGTEADQLRNILTILSGGAS